MEKSHGTYRNPKLLESVSDYSKYGPLGLCTTIREQYGDLITIKVWSILTEFIPKSNLGDVGEHKNRNSMKCSACGSEYHLKFKLPKVAGVSVRPIEE